MRGVRFAARGSQRLTHAVAAGLAAALCACAPPAPPDYTHIPVLFVHGHGLQPNNGAPLLDHLRERGYPPDFLAAVDIEPNRLANVAAAEQFIEPAVDALLAQARAAAAAAGAEAVPQRVALVGHSMGAVSSRWYARGNPDRVAALLTIAGANHGTDALCPSTDAGADDLCPAFAASEADSAIPVALNGTRLDPSDETPFGFGADAHAESVPAHGERAILYVTTRLASDAWIEPADSASLDGAGGLPLGELAGLRETSRGNYVLAAAEDHMSVLEHSDVLRAVEAALAARERR